MSEEFTPGTSPADEFPRTRWVAPRVEELGALSDITLQIGSDPPAECDPVTGEGCGPP